jgi:hypothetical protein
MSYTVRSIKLSLIETGVNERAFLGLNLLKFLRFYRDIILCYETLQWLRMSLLSGLASTDSPDSPETMAIANSNSCGTDGQVGDTDVSETTMCRLSANHKDNKNSFIIANTEKGKTC